MFFSQVNNKLTIQRFQADAAAFPDLRDMVAGAKHIRIAEHKERPRGRAMHQVQSCFQHNDTGAFGPDESARDMKSVFWQQIIQVVPGDAARNLWVPFTHEPPVLVPKSFQARVNSSADSPLPNNLVQFPLCRSAHSHSLPFVSENLQFMNVVGGSTRHLRMHPAGIIANHPANGAPGVRGRIRTKREVKFFRGVADIIADDARLHPGQLAFRVQLEQVVHIFRKIENHRRIATLPGEAGSATASENWSAELAAKRNRRDYIIRIPWNDDPDWYLAVIGAIRGVESSRAVIKTNFSSDAAAKSPRQPFGI